MMDKIAWKPNDILLTLQDQEDKISELRRMYQVGKLKFYSGLVPSNPEVLIKNMTLSLALNAQKETLLSITNMINGVIRGSEE
jgi:hypothetical protein